MPYPNVFTSDNPDDWGGQTSGWEGLAKRTPSQDRKAGIALDNERLKKLMELQQNDANDQRDLVEQAKAMPTGLDLSPLMALADSWSQGKSNLASTYKAPLQPVDKQAMIAKLRDLASKDQQQVTKDQLSSIVANGRQDTAMDKIAAAIAGRGQTPDWRVDRAMERAADSIHKAPNMKTYTDMANSVGETMFVLNKDDATVVEAHEALQNISRAISRMNVSSDYKQKQLAMPTLEEEMKKLAGFISSDPKQTAPAETKALLLKIGNRVLDTYDSSIRREAHRMRQGKHFRIKEAQEAMNEAADSYTSGDYMQELRDQYGIGPSELPKRDKDMKPAAGATTPGPMAIDPADWAKANDEQKQAFRAAAKAKKVSLPPGVN